MHQYIRIYALLAMLAVTLPATVQAEDNGMTARGIFTLLPASIFENTAEGLSDAEKQQLLAEGHTEFWEVAGETEDVIVFAALPFRDSAVALRLFRNTADGSVEAAIGTLGGPICTMELWRVDASGRMVPIDTPPEPDIRDFLDQGQKLPPDINPTVLICLGLGGLKAEPVFWNSSGMAHVPLANEVSFQWNGKAFEKQVTPRKEQSGERP